MLLRTCNVANALALAAAVTLTQSRTEEAGLQQTVSGLGSQGLVSVRLTGANNCHRSFKTGQ